MLTFQSRAAAAMTSVVHGRVLIDRGILPDELDRLSEALGGPADLVVLTHCHWDHVAAATRWGAPIVAHPDLERWLALVEAEEPLQDSLARTYARFGAGDAPRVLPPRPDLVLADGQTLALGGIVATAVHLPGHTGDGLGLLLDDTLVCGDILDSLELPLPMHDLDAYFGSLRRIEALLPEVRRVVPGHGPPLDAVSALAQLRQDRRYLEELDAAVRDAHARGDGPDWPGFAGMAWFGKGHPDRDAEHAMVVRAVWEQRAG